MLLEKDRLERIEKNKVENTVRWEEQVKIGKSAERLLNNPDWQRLEAKIKEAIKEKEDSLQETLTNIIITSKMTRDGNDQACSSIRLYYKEVEDYRYFLQLPRDEVEVGQDAEKSLQKLREEI